MGLGNIIMYNLIVLKIFLLVVILWINIFVVIFLFLEFLEIVRLCVN